METKKSVKANLENKKSLYFQIGVTLTIAMALVAFEWSSSISSEPLDITFVGDSYNEELIPLTRQDVPKPKPPAPIIQKIIIHDNFDEIKEPDLYFEEIDENTEIVFIPFEDEKPEEVPAVFLQEQPMFMGGDINQFSKYIAKNMKYPKAPKDNGITGRVHLKFTVNTKGYVESVMVTRGVHPELDAEAIRVVKSSPRWTPGKQLGRPVKASYQFSVLFILQGM